MKHVVVAALVAGAVAVPSAVAQSELYVTGGPSSLDIDEATLTAFTARGGIEFHELLGAEFEASFGLGAEDLGNSATAEIELENQFGGYLVGRYPVLPQLDVLGRIGYTTGEFQTSNGGVSTDTDADGFAFGVGGEYMITRQFGLRGDYTRIEADEDELDGGINVFALAAVYKFGSVR